MAKAIVCIGGTQLVGVNASISYTVSVIDTEPKSYAGDYQVNTSINMAANLLAWRNKIIAEVAGMGTTLAAADVIVFGGPA